MHRDRAARFLGVQAVEVQQVDAFRCEVFQRLVEAAAQQLRKGSVMLAVML
jgi:single-stranded DNA-binding protein